MKKTIGILSKADVLKKGIIHDLYSLDWIVAVGDFVHKSGIIFCCFALKNSFFECKIKACHKKLIQRPSDGHLTAKRSTEIEEFTVMGIKSSFFTEKRYTAGTLSYSLGRLLTVCVFLLMARQILSLISNALLTQLRPMLLVQSGATPTQIAIIIGTVPNILSTVLCPIISTISDKTRSKWGRRMPYLLFSAPVIGGLLALMGYYAELGSALQKIFPLSTANFPLIVLGILIILYQIAYLFPGSVIYCLEADLVPKECFGRYIAIASVFSSACNACFNYFILTHIFSSTKLTLMLFAAGYVGLYVLQALFVREGQYPPVEDKITRDAGFLKRSWEYVVMFFRQNYTQKIFLFFYFSYSLNQASTLCRHMYNILFATKDLQISVAFFGKIAAVSGIISAILAYFFGKLMDRTHPMLIFFIGGLLVIAANFFGYFFAIGPKTYAVVAVVLSLVYAFQELATMPLLISIFPKEKIGQYFSANALLSHIITMIAAIFAGLLTEKFGYRFMFVWDFVVTSLAMFALVFGFFEWKRYGGKNYQPPLVE